MLNYQLSLNPALDLGYLFRVSRLGTAPLQSTKPLTNLLQVSNVIVFTVDENVDLVEAKGSRYWISCLKNHVSVAICVSDISARNGEIRQRRRRRTKVATA